MRKIVILLFFIMSGSISNGTVFGKADPMTADLGENQGMRPNENGEFKNFPLAVQKMKWL